MLVNNLNHHKIKIINQNFLEKTPNKKYKNKKKIALS
jgi:hypothetical protein